MKTVKYTLILLLASSFAFTGCKKKEDDPEPVVYGTATIKGIVEADLDYTNNDQGLVREKAPAGTKVIAWISYADLITNASGDNYEKKYYEAAVNADGLYSLTIDVNNKPVNVTIIPVQFDYQTRKNATDYARSKYSANEVETTVVRGDTKVEDIYYNH